MTWEAPGTTRLLCLLLPALARQRVDVFSVDLESLKQEIERG